MNIKLKPFTVPNFALGDEVIPVIAEMLHRMDHGDCHLGAGPKYLEAARHIMLAIRDADLLPARGEGEEK